MHLLPVVAAIAGGFAVKNPILRLVRLSALLTLLLLTLAPHSPAQTPGPSTPQHPAFPPLTPEATGDILMARGQYEAAIDAYRRAPLDAVVWNKIGVAWDHLSAVTVAKADYERALALRPDYPDALNNLGSAWFEQKNYRKALDCYLRAASLNPRSATIQANLGTTYFALGRFTEGAAAYRTAFTLDPSVLDFDVPHLDESKTSRRIRARRDYCLAEIFASERLYNRTLDSLRHAVAEGFHNWKRLMHDSAFAQFRLTPEFAQLMIGAAPQGISSAPLPPAFSPFPPR